MATGTGGKRCAIFALPCIFYVLAGCSNGRGSVESGEAQEPPPEAPSTFAVRGEVTGLTGSGLVLQLNGAGDLPVESDGAFAFADSLADQAPYAVTVSRQPANPAQTCTPQNASGTIAGADATEVSIVCSTESFAIGGSVTSDSARGKK